MYAIRSYYADCSREDFIASYCRWVDRGDGTENLCLREKKNYDCILWDQYGNNFV